MRLTLHNYQTDSLLPQKDGVNFAHAEIANLMNSLNNPRIQVSFHNFQKLCQDEVYAYQVLSQTDCVISNVGPHAHYYFYLREKLNLNFRIIRDVRTALWSSYLLQEYLCQSFLRDTDTLLFPSMYALELINTLLPHLRLFPSFVCYPLMGTFPTLTETPKKKHSANEPIVLGYIGRLSEDKNFLQIIDLLIKLNQDEPGHYHLMACGDVHSPSCDPVQLAEKIASNTGQKGIFRYEPAVPHQKVWDLYRQFDVFIFPSTSNIETFGRVLIEASYCHLPVLASTHAATPELLPLDALSPVTYKTNTRFNTHYDFPLGQVDINDMADKLKRPRNSTDEKYRFYENHPKLFLQILLYEMDVVKKRTNSQVLDQTQKKFIQSIRLYNLPQESDKQKTGHMIAEMLTWFIELQSKDPGVYQNRSSLLLEISAHPERTKRFLSKNSKSNRDFTNVGGIDIELCHVAQFYPQFELIKPPYA